MLTSNDNYKPRSIFLRSDACTCKLLGKPRILSFYHFFSIEHGKACKIIFFISFKDAFVEFEERVCVPDFPEAFTQAYYMADATFTVFDRLMR